MFPDEIHPKQSVSSKRDQPNRYNHCNAVLESQARDRSDPRVSGLRSRVSAFVESA